jgi:hypothetical protein
MANPTVAVSTNKPKYAPGETITLTITYGDADRVSMEISVTVTDSQGNTGTATTSIVIDQGSVSVQSVPSRNWAKVSDSGTVAVFTAVA